MQLLAHADAVDYSLWPSPFDSTVPARGCGKADESNKQIEQLSTKLGSTTVLPIEDHVQTAAAGLRVPGAP